MSMERQRHWIVGAGLFLITLALYWPATNYSFVNIDDQAYVYENPEVLKGLSWESVKWAATSVVGGNWHPLTVWSHMADCSLYRLVAGGHHLTNILLHSVNAVLLWMLLRRMTSLRADASARPADMTWCCALVAALFAWHPLNVESVAWVSERKNVLSTLFFILTIWAYQNHTAKRFRAGFYYALSLILFALGLAAKSMLVTLPCVLLLLDFWPLRRISLEQSFGELIRRKQTWLLVLEKIPFLVLSVADSLITFVVQKQSGAVNSLAMAPLENRLLNVPVAYCTYLAKTFWPLKLCIFYPFPETVHATTAVVSTIFLVGLTFLAWRWRARYSWFLVGWLWFLGTMVPVIGLVQVGGQAMADRYAYLPLIGIFLAIACGLNAFWLARPQFRIASVILVFVFLGFVLILTGRQLKSWQNSITLFAQAVAVNPGNTMAQNTLGRALATNGNSQEAIEHFTAAVLLHPNIVAYQYDLGFELIRAKRFKEAENALAAASMQIPDNPMLHNTRGVALMLDHQPVEAQKEFDYVIGLRPDYTNAIFNLGKLLLAEGQSQAAITNLNKALKFQPDWPEALQNLARAYAANGDFSNAVVAAGRALQLAQTNHHAALAGQIALELKTYQNALAPQSSGSQTNLPNTQQP